MEKKQYIRPRMNMRATVDAETLLSGSVPLNNEQGESRYQGAKQDNIYGNVFDDDQEDN